MSSDDTQKLIEQEQRDIEAYQSQMDTAMDRDRQDEIPGLQQKVNEKTAQIKDLQSKLSQQREQEKREAEKEAYEEGKDDGRIPFF